MIAALPLSVSAAGEYVPGNPRWSGYQNQVQWDRPAGAASGDSFEYEAQLLLGDDVVESKAVEIDTYLFFTNDVVTRPQEEYTIRVRARWIMIVGDPDGQYMVADEAVGDGEKAVAILNGNILATDQAFYQIMYDDISENDLSYEEKTTNADGTPAAYLPKFGGGNRYRLVKLELLSRYYSDVLTIAHDYIITADYKLLPATEAIGEDYESGYIAYPPDVMEKLLALDGY